MESRNIEVKTQGRNMECKGCADKPTYVCDGNGEYRDLKTGEILNMEEILKRTTAKEEHNEYNT